MDLNTPKRINNIEDLRIRYRKSSILTGKNDKERKAILTAWRATFKGRGKDWLEANIAAISLLRHGVGELSALEYMFRLVEFVSYVDKFAISNPDKKEGQNDN